jgi:phosphonate transport system substrate-binding protein
VKKLLLIVIVLSLFVACKPKEYPLGSEENPVKLYFVPSGEVQKIIQSGDSIAEELEAKTGLKFKTAVPTSYAAVIEAMGNGEADMAFLPTFAYVIANSKYGVEPALKIVRYGSSQYRGQLIVQASSDIQSVSDINGKKVAYTDAASTSGAIYPSALFALQGITPAETFYAGGHSQAVLAVYEGSADVGCTFEDARGSVEETYPDVMEKTRIVGYTDWIPNDSVSFRKDFPSDFKAQIVSTLQAYVEDEQGKKVLKDLYSITGFDPATDADYQVVRDSLSALGKTAEEFLGE